MITFHRISVVAGTIALAGVLAACTRDAAPPTPADPATRPSPDTPAGATEPQTMIGRAAQSAIDEAREQLANEPLKLGGSNGINFNGTRLGGGSDLPQAEITAVGDFSIEGQPVTLDARQREHVMAYREQMLGVIGAGMDIGIQGADLAGKALKQVFDGLLSGNPDQIQDRVRAESDAIEASAQQLCLRLPALLAAQDTLADSVAAFKPYATLTQADIDRCSESSTTSVDPVVAPTAPDLHESLRDAIEQTAQAAANATTSVPPPGTPAVPQPVTGATATSTASSQGSNVVSVNGVRFLLPPGGSSVTTENSRSSIVHPQGLRVDIQDDALLIDGRRYPRPAAGSVVDLRTKNIVQINEAVATPDP